MKTWMIVTGVCIAAAAPIASAATVVRHEGATDPETEDFYVAGVDVHLIETGPVLGDQGYDAWKYVNPRGPEMQYRYDFTPAERTQIADGWTVRARLRVVDSDVGIGGGLCAIDMFDTANTGNRYQIRVGSDGAGDQIVSYNSFPYMIDLVTLEGGSIYHLYEMSWDGNEEGLVTISIDGSEVLTEYPGAVDGDGRNQFKVGCGTERGEGQVNYNLFEVALPPGPDCSPGDADGDGDVDDGDLSLLLANWGSETATCAQGEFSEVPPVNDDDLSLLLANWTGPLAAAVPEPVTIGLVGLGSLVLLRRRK